MSVTYRIRDWNLHFENNKSREREQRTWCSIPNKQDGLEYGRLMQEPDGEALYGGFVAMVLVASKQQRPRDGYLTGTGRADGDPYTAADLAIKTKCREPIITRALDVCTSVNVYWIETYIDGALQVPAGCPRGAEEVPAKCPPGALREEKRREEKKEQRNNAAGETTPRLDFSFFWNLWEPKLSRAAAEKAWKKLSDADRQAAVDGLPPWLAARSRAEALGVFVGGLPHASTWLNGKRWRDEFPSGGAEKIPESNPVVDAAMARAKQEW